MAQVLPFNGFYAGNSAKNSSRECVNFMPVRHDEGALSSYTLESTTGITGPVTLNSGISLGARVASEVITWGNKYAGLTGAKTLFVTSGVHLVASKGDGVESFRLPGGFLPYDVRFAKGADKVLINTRSTSASQSGWVYDGLSASAVAVDYTAQIGLGGNENIADVAYFGNRYLLMSESNNTGLDHKGRVYYSDINNPEVYSGTNFFRGLEQSSKNTGMHVLNNRLYLFSEDGYSVWTVTPNVNTPFAQQKGSAGAIGMLDPMGKCEAGGNLYFIGRDGGKLGLYALSGGAPQKISSGPIDYVLNSDTDKRGIVCFSFTDNGRKFVAFSIENDTFCVDIETGEYHKRSTNGGRWGVVGTGYNEANNNRSVFIGKDIVSLGSNNYSIQSGFSDETIGTEFGQVVDRELITSPFNSNGVSNVVRELSFQADIDYGNETPVTLPKLGVSVSSDFGKTYKPEKQKEFDAVGSNNKILRFMNIGFFRQAFVFKLKTSTKYPHKILKMLTRLEKGFRQI